MTGGVLPLMDPQGESWKNIGARPPLGGPPLGGSDRGGEDMSLQGQVSEAGQGVPRKPPNKYAVFHSDLGIFWVHHGSTIQNIAEMRY